MVPRAQVAMRQENFPRPVSERTGNAFVESCFLCWTTLLLAPLFSDIVKWRHWFSDVALTDLEKCVLMHDDSDNNTG